MARDTRIIKRNQEFFDRLPGMRSVFPNEHLLLSNIKKNLPLLKEKLNENSGKGLEYFFYQGHCGSNKVYQAQRYTEDIVNTLRSLSPLEKKPIEEVFEKIYRNGTNRKIKIGFDKNWNRDALPVLDAFLHARIFLELTVKYGEELEYAPACLPYGWAAVLCFYGLR